MALADENYTFHENLHVNQTVPVVMNYDCKTKLTTTTNGSSEVTDSTDAHHWKLKLTILQQKDGSDTRCKAEIDPSSFDATKNAGADEKKTVCPFAGKPITLTRLADESFINDFSGHASSDDTNLLNNFLCPDEDFYPDKPVAVGDVWDNSDKLSKHSTLGPKDQLLSQCRLDWVKTIDGKQMAQISNSLAIVYQEKGNLEEDWEGSAILLVDMSTQMIVKADQTGSSKFITPASEATQVTGGTEFTYHEQVLPTNSYAATAP
jgi:hypothetical protein